MKLGAIGVILAFVTGLWAPHAHAVPPAPLPVAALVHTVDEAVRLAASRVDAQHDRSARALDVAVAQLPVISAEDKEALLRCIDHHLGSTRRDLIAAMASRELAPDARLAALADVEVGEYRSTHAQLLALRRMVNSWA